MLSLSISTSSSTLLDIPDQMGGEHDGARFRCNCAEWCSKCNPAQPDRRRRAARRADTAARRGAITRQSCIFSCMPLLIAPMRWPSSSFRSSSMSRAFVRSKSVKKSAYIATASRTRRPCGERHAVGQIGCDGLARRAGFHAADGNFAGSRREQPHRAFDQRGFARAVRAEQTDQLSRLDREAHVAQRGTPSVFLFKMVCGVNSRHDYPSSCSSSAASSALVRPSADA